jgi:hypothetical protein
LASKEQLKKFLFKDKNLKLGPSIIKGINKFLRGKALLEKFSIECENYEDIFDSNSTN